MDQKQEKNEKKKSDQSKSNQIKSNFISPLKAMGQNDLDPSDSIDDSSSTGTGSVYDSSHSPASGDVESDRGNDIRNTIIKDEETAVRKARCLVGFAMIACAVAVSVSVYFFAKKGDRGSFELEVSFREYNHYSRTKEHTISTNFLL